MHPDSLQSVQVTVNDHPVALKKKWHGKSGTLQARVPAQAQDGARRRLGIHFRADKTFQPVLTGKCGRRPLSTAVSRIRLTPAGLFSYWW